MSLSVFDGRHGRFIHDSRDAVIGHSFRMYGEWAEEEIYLLSSIVKPGDTVLDIGANVGSHTVPLSNMIGPKGMVIAVDGQSIASSLLAFNIIINDLQNVRRLEALVGSRSEICFDKADRGSSDNIGGVSFQDIHEKVARLEPGLKRPVAIFALDDLDCPNCQIIKIDVEGMEFDVLSGALRLIGKNRPFIYFEQHRTPSFEKNYNLLNSIGYRLFMRAANPFNKNNFNKCDINIFGETRETNILAIPNEIDYTPPNPIALDEIESINYSWPTASVPEGWSLPIGAYAEIYEKSSMSLLQNGFNSSVLHQ